MPTKEDCSLFEGIEALNEVKNLEKKREEVKEEERMTERKRERKRERHEDEESTRTGNSSPFIQYALLIVMN